MSINKVFISGNLTRDPDLRRTQGGMEILTWGMAVNDRKRNPQTGEWEDYANFIDVVCFGNRASSLAGIIKKGMKLTVEGKLRWSQWEKDGQKRSKIDVVADDVVLSPRGSQGFSDSGSQQQRNQQPTKQTQPQNAPQGVYDDDIPF